MNMYAYVGNDPVNMTDSSGKCGGGWCVAAAAACAKSSACRGAVVKAGKAVVKAFKGSKKTRNFTVKKSSKKIAKEQTRHAHGGKVKPTPKGLNGKQMKKRVQKQNKPESHPDSNHKNKHFHRSDKTKEIELRNKNPHVEYPKKQ